MEVAIIGGIASVIVATIGGLVTFLGKKADVSYSLIQKSIEDLTEQVKAVNEKAERNGACALATTRSELNRYCNQYLEAGYIPKADHAAFMEMGSTYIAAGGNTAVKDKFERCQELPLK